MAPTAPSSTKPASTAVRLRSQVPVLVLVGWTLFVWVGRLRNIVTDDALTGWSMVWRLGLAATFTLGALVALAAVLVRACAVPATANALATFGIIVWLIRGTDIALGDHPAAFIAVHTVLALVTIALSAWVIRSQSHRWTH